MSRQFKFRVWARAWKPPRMIELSELNMYGQKTIQEALDYANAGPNFVLMEFTGLLDKNGKEIYEGDIVSTFYPDGNSIGEVFFDKDTCSYRIQTKEYKLPIVIARFIDDSFSHLVPVADSVLGNVFENPELLKT